MEQAIEVKESLAQPASQVMSLADSLLPVRQKLFNPPQQERASDTAPEAACDLVGLMVGEHGRNVSER